MTSLDELHDEMRAGFAAVTSRLDQQNTHITDLRLWRARMEGARHAGVGLWQTLGTLAAVTAAGTAVVIAIGGP